MKNLPKITIIQKNLIDEEVRVFLNFLNNPKYPQNRNKIFQSFPEFKIEVEQVSDFERKKEITRKFILGFYKKNKETIYQIIKESENMLKEKGKVALETLSRLMDYEWPSGLIYNAIPTILPFSPFNKNTFNFSILATIHGKSDKDVLFISIHEISHFIFFEIMEKMALKMHSDAEYYFRETLTAMLLNQEPLCNILKLNNYSGNPEIKDIKIETGGDIVGFIDFIRNCYQKIKISENRCFRDFLKETVILVMPVSQEFSKKRKLWDEFGNKLFDNNEKFQQYVFPIKIEAPRE